MSKRKVVSVEIARLNKENLKHAENELCCVLTVVMLHLVILAVLSVVTPKFTSKYCSPMEMNSYNSMHLKLEIV